MPSNADALTPCSALLSGQRASPAARLKTLCDLRYLNVRGPNLLHLIRTERPGIPFPSCRVASAMVQDTGFKLRSGLVHLVHALCVHLLGSLVLVHKRSWCHCSASAGCCWSSDRTIEDGTYYFTSPSPTLALLAIASIGSFHLFLIGSIGPPNPRFAQIFLPSTVCNPISRLSFQLQTGFLSSITALLFLYQFLSLFTARIIQYCSRHHVLFYLLRDR